MTKEERHSHWQEIIDRQRTSGMTIAAYCRDIQIKSSYFYTIRRRLKERESAAGGFLELRPGKMSASTATSSGIHIRIAGNLYLDVERGFDPFTLRLVIETLNSGSRCLA